MQAAAAGPIEAQAARRQADADAQTEALKRVRERSGRRGMLGFVSDLTNASKTLGGGS